MELRDLRYSHRNGYVTQRSFASRELTLGDARGREAVYRIDAITRPVRVFNGTEEITISDAGYVWYQLALRDRRIWMHASFDDALRLIEVYFDLTAGNRFDDPENPCFEDRWLDVVLTPEGEIRVLDRDELDGALAEGLLDRAEYEAVLETGDALCRDLERNATAVLRFCEEHTRALLPLLLSPLN